MVARLQVAGLSDPGRMRSLNEDRYYFKFVQSSDEHATGLFIVADGLGGYLAGEVASHWAVETVQREMAQIFKSRDPSDTKQVRPQELWTPSDSDSQTASVQVLNAETFRLISYAIRKANEVLLGYAQQKPDEAGGMGSTIVVLVIQDELATVGSLGDSRAYLWRRGQLHQITTDHTLPGELVTRGQLEPDKLPSHPQRHILQRCLGRHVLIEPDIFRPVQLQSGDRLLLCSDGLWNMVTPEQRISEFMEQEPDPNRLIHELVRASNEAGGEDNITAIAINIEE